MSRPGFGRGGTTFLGPHDAVLVPGTERFGPSGNHAGIPTTASLRWDIVLVPVRGISLPLPRTGSRSRNPSRRETHQNRPSVVRTTGGRLNNSSRGLVSPCCIELGLNGATRNNVPLLAA